MDVYNEVTAYEVAFSFRDVPHEVDTLVDWFERDGLGSLTSVIELAAGPADHALEFARRGVTATALDLNAAMCRRAEERRDAEQLTMRVICADMSNFDFEGKADLALLMMASASHLLSLDSMLGMLASTARAVREGGLLVMEMSHPADFLTPDPRADVEWEMQRDDMAVKFRWGTPDDDLDPVSQVRQTTVTVVTSRSGQAPILHETVVPQRLWSATEVDAAVRLSREWEVRSWYGDMSRDIDITDGAAWRMIPVLRRVTESRAAR
jgi:ubiquinone/menaquinone biosynthesis C-methylase UbiE